MGGSSRRGSVFASNSRVELACRCRRGDLLRNPHSGGDWPQWTPGSERVGGCETLSRQGLVPCKRSGPPGGSWPGCLGRCGFRVRFPGAISPVRPSRERWIEAVDCSAASDGALRESPRREGARQAVAGWLGSERAKRRAANLAHGAPDRGNRSHAERLTDATARTQNTRQTQPLACGSFDRDELSRTEARERRPLTRRTSDKGNRSQPEHPSATPLARSVWKGRPPTRNAWEGQPARTERPRAATARTGSAREWQSLAGAPSRTRSVQKRPMGDFPHEEQAAGGCRRSLRWQRG